MKKELIISIIIIILVIIGNVVTQNYTKQCVDIINEDLSELKKEVIPTQENEHEAKKIIYHIGEEWEQMQEKLAFYIEHDELEKVETQIFLLKGNVEAGEMTQILPELEKCIFILQHIEDKNALDIKNIF